MADENNDQALRARPPGLVGVIAFKITEPKASKDFYVSDTLLEQKARPFIDALIEQLLCSTAITLTDVDIEIFEVFVEWLGGNGGNKYLLLGPTLNPMHIPFVEGAWGDMLPVIKAYIFGYKYEIPQLRRDVLLQLSDYMQRHATWKSSIGPGYQRSLYTHYLSPREIRYVYNNTNADCSLRRFFVDNFCAADTDVKFTEPMLRTYPKEFLADVLLRRAELRIYKSGSEKALAKSISDWELYGKDVSRSNKRMRMDESSARFKRNRA